MGGRAAVFYVFIARHDDVDDVYCGVHMHGEEATFSVVCLFVDHRVVRIGSVTSASPHAYIGSFLF